MILGNSVTPAGSGGGNDGLCFAIYDTNNDTNVTGVYPYTEGQTWADWVASPYNTIGLFIDGGGTVCVPLSPQAKPTAKFITYTPGTIASVQSSAVVTSAIYGAYAIR